MAVCVHCATPLPDGSNFCSICGTPTFGDGSSETPTLTPQGREIFERLKTATAGRYEIMRELGRGGMAVVFLGYQKSLDRPIAIKVLLPILGYDSDVVERFQREARTQGKLDHPSIISVYEVYNTGGLTFFTMPYIAGRSLRAQLLEQPRPSIHKVQRYLRQSAEALAYAHRRGVVHRDVKPDNILLDQERDSVILTDFGIAKALAAETTLTTPGDLLGTPQYMSPEQGEGKGNLDGRTDQYSLGLIGYEMLAGRRAFEADTLAELMYKHRFEEPESLDAVRPDAPAPLREAIATAIGKDREQRYPSMEAFLAALEGPTWLEPEGGLEASQPAEPAAAQDPTVRVPAPETASSDFPGPDGELAPTIRTPPGRETRQPGASTSESQAARRAHSGDRQRRRWRGLVGVGAVVVVVGLVAALWRSPMGEWTGLRSTGAGAVERTTDPGGSEGPGDAQVAGIDEPTSAEGRESTPSGGDTGGGMPAGAGPDGDDPSADEGAASPDRSRAVEAQRAAHAARDAARAAGAGDLFTARLAELERRLSTADSDLESGRVDQAMMGFADIHAELERLTRDATMAMANAAAAVRDSAAARRQVAVAARADSLFPQEMAAQDSAWERGLETLAAGRAAAARQLLSGAADGYAQLAQRASDELRQRADEARVAMESERDAAARAGAERRAPKRMALADAMRSRALAKFRQERYAEAVPLFREAGDAYTRIADSLADGGAAGRPRTGTDSADEAIRALIERFRLAYEQEDVEGMRADVYGGELPADDARYFRVVFERADDIQARAHIENLEAGESTARARLQLALRFRQARTRQLQETTENLQLQFRREAEGWRLEGLRRR